MPITFSYVGKPIWADPEHITIDCIVIADHLPGEQLSFTASPNDEEEHGRQLFADLVGGVYGQ